MFNVTGLFRHAPTFQTASQVKRRMPDSFKAALRTLFFREADDVVNTLDKSEIRKVLLKHKNPVAENEAKLSGLQDRVAEMVRSLLGAWKPRSKKDDSDLLACFREAAVLSVKAVGLARGNEQASVTALGNEDVVAHATKFAELCCRKSLAATAGCSKGVGNFLVTVSTCMTEEQLSENIMLDIIALMFSPRMILKYENLFHLGIGAALAWHARDIRDHDVGLDELKNQVKKLGDKAVKEAARHNPRAWSNPMSFLPRSFEDLAHGASKLGEAAVLFQGAGAIGDVRARIRA